MTPDDRKEATVHNQNNSRTAHRTGSTQTLIAVFLAILTGAVPVALNHSASRDLLLNLQLLLLNLQLLLLKMFL